MKNFANPEIEVVRLCIEDVVTTSNDCTTYNPACGGRNGPRLIETENNPGGANRQGYS